MRMSAEATPSVLRWARESAGLSVDEAAGKLNVKPQKIKAWEDGKANPSFKQLENAAHLYRRPSAVFFLAQPPSDPPLPHDFRRIEASQELTYPLRIALRTALTRQDMVRELNGLSEEEPKASLPKADLASSDPQKLAAKLREMTGVALTDQKRWPDHYVALRAWVDAIERLGVFVFQTGDVPVSQMRAFSIYDFAVPVIVLNAKDAPVARCFSLFHELAHLCFRESSLCDLAEAEKSKSAQSVEAFCNEVAANILAPETALANDLQPGAKIDDGAIAELAKKYRVSREVIVRRVATMGRISRAEYREFIDQLPKQERVSGTPIVKPPTKIVRNNGRKFVRMVLSAYSNDHITASDVSDYLGMKLKHLAAVQEKALSASALSSDA